MSNGRGGTQKKSRVNLKYEVETNGAIKQQDLKAVVGVMSDLSFDSSVQKKDVAQRAFLEVNKENFDNRMAEVRPAVALEVPNVLDASGGSLPAKIEFNSIKDFGPDAVAKQIEPLRKLVEIRDQLKGLKGELNDPAFAKKFKELLDQLQKAVH
jgi:type VI secretion system protein ImpB